jgi:hypothetical protein
VDFGQAAFEKHPVKEGVQATVVLRERRSVEPQTNHSLATRVLHSLGMVASIGVALANYAGKETAAEIEAIYADIIRPLEGCNKDLKCCLILRSPA